MDQFDEEFDFFEQPADQFIDEALEQDSFQDQTTQTFMNDDLHINEETRKRINVDFKNKLEKFVPRLFSDCSNKTAEITALSQILHQIRVSEKIIYEEIKKEQNEEIDAQGRKKRIQERNTEQAIQAKMKRHLVEGQKIDFEIHDKHYTPLYLSHSPCVIFITAKYPHKTLDVIHSLCKYIDEDADVFDKNVFKEQLNKFGDGKKIQLVIQQIQSNHLIVQLPNGYIKFEIKAGNQNQDLDIYKDQIMRIYCTINPELKKMCAFLNYWAYQRGILGEHALPEFALYCMVIDFFMIQTLVPNIFTDKYCLWGKDKKELRKQIQRTNDPRIKAFERSEYIEQNIRKSGRKIQKIFWITFPKTSDEIKDIQQIWEKEKEFQKNRIAQTNLGYQISVFFHIWNQQEKYQRPLSFSNDFEQQKDEIGLIVRNPFITNQNLTPLLVKRTKNAEFKSQNMYFQVKQEFQRAYDLILSGEIGKLCDRQQILL